VQPLLQWKTNKYYLFWVCVCSLSYPAGNVHAPYCYLWPVRLYYVFPYNLHMKYLRRCNKHNIWQHLQSKPTHTFYEKFCNVATSCEPELGPSSGHYTKCACIWKLNNISWWSPLLHWKYTYNRKNRSLYDVTAVNCKVVKHTPDLQLPPITVKI